MKPRNLFLLRLLYAIGAMAFVGMMGLMACAQTTQPTTAPTSQPTTRPARLSGLASISGIQISHAGTMAPETVHVDVVGIDGQPFADRYLHYSWDMGDSAGRYAKWNLIPAGWNVAHLYESAGSYTVTCTVSDDLHRSQTFTVPVVVAPDTRKHIKVSTYAEAFAACAADTYIEVAPGSKIDPAGASPLLLTYRNLVLDGGGTSELRCNAANFQVINEWPGKSQDVLVRGFKVVADTPDPGASMGLPRESYKGWLGWIRGAGTTLADLTIDHCSEGIQLDVNASYCLLQDLSTVDAWSVTNSNFWVQGNSIVELGCIGKGSRFENVRRCADYGLHRGLCFMGEYTCPPELASPPFQLKCPNTMRTVSDSCVAWCHFTGHWIEYCPRSEFVEVRNCQFQWNTLTDCHLSIQAPVHEVRIRNITFVTDTIPLVFTMQRGAAQVDGIDVTDSTVVTSKPRTLSNLPAGSVPLATYSESGVSFLPQQVVHPTTRPTTQPAN